MPTIPTVDRTKKRSTNPLAVARLLSTNSNNMEKYTPVQRMEIPMQDVEVLSGDIHERKLGWKATVKIDGQEYDVIGRNCDLPHCYCDDEIINSKQHAGWD